MTGNLSRDLSRKIDDRAWAPRQVAVSGPDFLRLTSEEKADIQRLHQNLVHPNPDVFQKLLKERKATEAVLAGVKD